MKPLLLDTNILLRFITGEQWNSWADCSGAIRRAIPGQ